MRNPKWERDEIILALDLYFKIEPGQIHAKNQQIINLSKILNELPIHSNRPDETKFRNANGVTLKLSNFCAIDPNYVGKGMQSFSKLDKEVFEEFFNKKDHLAAELRRIKSKALLEKLENQVFEHDNQQDKSFSVKEGKTNYKLHKYFERNQSLINRKKKYYFQLNGKLDCECCGFDFHKKYGDLGFGYIECHHITPLSELDTETRTTINDLVLVCANCHRMLHRKKETLSIKKLKQLINV